MKDNISIVEKYISIQGETTFAGRPAHFIRLGGCNLACKYCDTKFSNDFRNFKEVSIFELANEISASLIKIAVITGGEPLLQKNTFPLMEMLLEKRITVILETNGSLPIQKVPGKVVKIIDCKCPMSGEEQKMKFANFALLKGHDQVKFVISGRKDYDYCKHIVDKYELYKKTENILLSPVISRINPSSLAKWMIEDEFYGILNLQLHRIIWPGKRKGV